MVVRETEAACGNGEVELGEQCDDGNEQPDDACTDGCKIARCGDAILRNDLTPDDLDYEACDDGNEDDDDACLVNCFVAACGVGSCDVILRKALRF